MPARKLRTIFLSNPQAVFFDTGVLIALFNKSEKAIADAAIDQIVKFPHASRHMVTPSLVELFYKLRKVISPSDIQKNLDHLGITFLPIASSQEQNFYKSFCGITYKSEFDYADYYLCSAALMFNHSLILTIDRDDLPLALRRAQEHTVSKSHVQLLPFV